MWYLAHSLLKREKKILKKNVYDAICECLLNTAYEYWKKVKGKIKWKL